MGKPLDEYTDEEWEAEKAEARERIDAEAAARPVPTFMERLAELARELEPDMDGVCTADQLLSGIDTPRELTFEEWGVFVRECFYDLKRNAEKNGGKFDALGDLRMERFLQWAIELEPERAIMAFKTAVSTFRLPLNTNSPTFDRYADKFKGYVMQVRNNSTTIAEIVGE